MQIHTKQVQEELVHLKGTYKETSEDIIDRIEKLSSHMIRDFSAAQVNLTKLNEEVYKAQHDHTLQVSEIELLQARCDGFDAANTKMREDTARIDLLKTDKASFVKMKKKL